jgi:PIN domain nuclease of toxin-antitoxin system
MIVLDTCAVLWLAFNRENLSSATLRKIDNDDELIISTMSFWEIGVKIRKKKLEIPLDLAELVHLYANNASVFVEPPDLEIVLRSLDLKWDHRDPVDRFIVATAQKHSCQIATSDQVIRKFYRKTIR